MLFLGFLVALYCVFSYLCHHFAFEHSHHSMKNETLPKLKFVPNLLELTPKVFLDKIEDRSDGAFDLLEEFQMFEYVIGELCSIWNEPMFRNEKGCENSNPCDLFHSLLQLEHELRYNSTRSSSILDDVQDIFDATFDPQNAFVHVTNYLDNYHHHIFVNAHKSRVISSSLKFTIPRDDSKELLKIVARQLEEFHNNHIVCFLEYIIPAYIERERKQFEKYESNPGYCENIQVDKVENRKLAKFGRDKDILFVLIPELAKESFQAIVKITTLLSIRNWKMRIYNLAYQLLPPIVIFQLIMIFVLYMVPIVPLSLILFAEFSYFKLREKSFGNGSKLREELWTFQIIDRIKSQKPKVLTPNQYKKYLKRLRRQNINKG